MGAGVCPAAKNSMRTSQNEGKEREGGSKYGKKGDRGKRGERASPSSSSSAAAVSPEANIAISRRRKEKRRGRQRGFLPSLSFPLPLGFPPPSIFFFFPHASVFFSPFLPWLRLRPLPRGEEGILGIRQKKRAVVRREGEGKTLGKGGTGRGKRGGGGGLLQGLSRNERKE